ncbi:dolichyl-phosphate-mannose--protein mannosyltransferase [Nonomuraea candida]|uniref:dolichyl-phosphate-mannose--protein mannosyltransferase n=1 Tax=Nonomuraea candida TaxID=359159 RepID=UPI000693C753|nr:phospholipid carrier-dependent glycosyltransferase [Nonomuraea candida]
MPADGWWGWAGPLFVTVLGGALRFLRLGEPHAVVFDETHYIKGAYALLTFGVERMTLDTDKDPVANRMIMADDLGIWRRCPVVEDCAEYVAHPPLGKWMIAVGEWLFGMTPFGWRFAGAVAGTLSILILARVARRMTRSTLLGCLAGLLLALDGLHFVLSRTALLDVFLMFWVLAAFACVVADRDRVRQRSPALEEVWPGAGVRPWRLAAGACLGAACAVKWSGVFFLLAFAALTLMWDAGARRALGLRPRPAASLPGLAGAFALVPATVYVLSWSGWFLRAEGWGRNWERATQAGPGFFVVDSLRSWLGYHLQVLGFHTGLATPHTYMSEPWQWPLLQRPVAFHYVSPPDACGAKDCSQAVLGVGTPALWYLALPALVVLVARYAAVRDWRAGAVPLAYAAGWLPWFSYALSDNRTMYLFYLLPAVPFMVLALVIAAGLALGPGGTASPRRATGAAVVGAGTLLILVNFWWLYPVLSGETITYAEWWARMLMRSWV